MKIYNYDKLLEEIKKVALKEGFKKGEVIVTDSLIEIPYYTYGNGNNHIVLVGGTHGSEIISVNLVLDIMKHINLIDKNDFTIHFIPVLNPEGYIISTSTVLSKIDGNNSKNIEKFSYEYYLNYKYDCTHNESVKKHQLMFSDINYNCITYEVLKNKVKSIYDKYSFPDGSMVIWRSNGSGIDLNREHPLMELSFNNITYGSDNLRYNNIRFNTPGPLGIYKNKVESVENKFLFDLICKLYNENKYAGTMIYHSTGGSIYYEPNIKCEHYEEYKKINYELAKKYSLKTKYKCQNGLIKDGYKLENNKDVNSNDEYLRIMYPAVLLIELSYMGGNPLGPFGDEVNNYKPTIKYNRLAFIDFIKECKKIKDSTRKN